MEAEIIHAVGVCFDVRERASNIIHAQACGVISHHPAGGGLGCGTSSRWGSRRPVWVKRWILGRRYGKSVCLPRTPNISSRTAKKYPRKRTGPRGGNPGARKTRRAA